MWGWWVGGHSGIIPGFLLSRTVRAHSQDGPHHAQAQVCWKESQHSPFCKPKPTWCQDRGCSSRPFLQKSGGLTTSPQAGDCPKPPVSPRFHQGHQRGGISSQQLNPLCREDHHQNPTSHPANIWQGGSSWMWVCFASQAPARRSQHEPG